MIKNLNQTKNIRKTQLLKSKKLYSGRYVKYVVSTFF